MEVCGVRYGFGFVIFLYGYTVVFVLFVEKTILSLLNLSVLCLLNFTSVGNQLRCVCVVCSQALSPLDLLCPGGSEVKASACSVGDLGSIPGSGRSPGEGNGTLLQYCRLENPMDGGAWQAAVHGVAKSWTRLSNFTFFLPFFMSVLYCLPYCGFMYGLKLVYKSSNFVHYFQNCFRYFRFYVFS